MLRQLALVTMTAAAVCACSDDTEEKDTGIVGDIRQSQVWKDGTKLSGLVRIFEGATVEIEPGAKITCTEAVQIQVGGVLRVKSPGKHASIDCERWRGILIAQNGQIDAEGLDLHNAEVGVETTNGAGSASLVDSSILVTPRPFLVGTNSKLSLTKVVATTPTTLREFEVSVSEVFGSLVAKYLDYEANDNEGVMVMKDGEADIEDSTLKAKNGLDLISSYGGKSIKVRYTTMRGGHCGLHVDREKGPDGKVKLDGAPTGSIEVHHVTSENQYGITLWATSATGPHSVRDSNLLGDHSWLDLQGDNGPVTFENAFTSGGETILPPERTDRPTFPKAPAELSDAKPR